ncbi:hypothetical protein A0J61_08660, partial [Choanephora cucurbitarum]
ALKCGIPRDDIVTMGNWSNDSVFENHYRREHLTQFDFTNTLLPVAPATSFTLESDFLEEDDEFYDAVEHQKELVSG